jgi:hypothetical protein
MFEFKDDTVDESMLVHEIDPGPEEPWLKFGTVL